MSRTNIILAYNLKDIEIEILKSFNKEFDYKIISLDHINDLNNYKFMIAFINLESESDIIKEEYKEILTKYKRKIKLIVTNRHIVKDDNDSTENIFTNPEKVRLEILKAYQTFIGIDKATKPFSDRLRRLVIMIRVFQSERVITLEELIDYFHKDRRTILRDIRLLKDIGVAIIYDKEKKAYVLLKEYKPII